MKPLFKHSLKLQFKSISYILWGLGAPIFWVIINGVSLSWVKDESLRIQLFSEIFPMGLIFFSYSVAFFTSSMDLANARINRQLKQLSLANITPFLYICNLFLQFSITYLISLIPVLLIATLWFKLSLSWMIILSCLVFPSISLVFSLFLAVIIANVTNNIKTTNIVVLVSFYLIFFTNNGFMFGQSDLSGVMKYLKLITPTGCLALISSSIYNSVSFVNVWYAYVCLAFHATWISYLAVKLFKWV